MRHWCNMVSYKNIWFHFVSVVCVERNVYVILFIKIHLLFGMFIYFKINMKLVILCYAIYFKINMK